VSAGPEPPGKHESVGGFGAEFCRRQQAGFAGMRCARYNHGTEETLCHVHKGSRVSVWRFCARVFRACLYAAVTTNSIQRTTKPTGIGAQGVGRHDMSKTILAVDDEKHIVRLVQINLQKEGYNVVMASNGREALEKVNAERPDLIIMDVMMPELDGFGALKILKEDEDTATIPVIMLTAKAQDADVFQGWKSGADLYLTKPFNPQELITFVKRIFQGQNESNEDDVYEVDESDTYNIDDIDETLMPPQRQ
jgi:CheY-like chemotaxis protein